MLRWWFELHDRHMRCFVKVDATALKDYTLVDIDARTDIISLSCGLRGRRSGASDNPVIIGQVAALTNALNSWGEEFQAHATWG